MYCSYEFAYLSSYLIKFLDTAPQLLHTRIASRTAKSATSSYLGNVDPSFTTT
jgi:hypothetical protein